MIIGAATAAWLAIFLLVLIVLLLGAIYHHMKNALPWDGIDRRGCNDPTPCEDAIARYHREHHDQGSTSTT